MTVLNTKELSEYLGIGRTTIYELRKAGSIPFFRIGSKILFSKEAIDEWTAKGGTHEEVQNKST